MFPQTTNNFFLYTYHIINIIKFLKKWGEKIVFVQFTCLTTSISGSVYLLYCKWPTLTPAPLLCFFHPPSHHPSPPVSSRFHFIPVQRISVKQAQPSPPASIPTVPLFSRSLILGAILRHSGPHFHPHPLTPCSILLMQTFRNLCRINKKINPRASLTVLHPPHFSLLFFLTPPLLSSPLLPSHPLCSLEFFLFDKRNSGGF